MKRRKLHLGWPKPDKAFVLSNRGKKNFAKSLMARFDFQRGPGRPPSFALVANILRKWMDGSAQRTTFRDPFGIKRKISLGFNPPDSTPLRFGEVALRSRAFCGRDRPRRRRYRACGAFRL